VKFRGFIKSGFVVETVDLSAQAQVPAVYVLQFPGFGLSCQKALFCDPPASE
jgi:hypothetical protein